MIRFIKRFSEWMILKKKLNSHFRIPPIFKEAEGVVLY